MTFSILARNPQTGEIGAGVATGLPAVGGFVLHLRAGAGGLATQGYSTNTLYGPRGLALLEANISAEEVCRRLTMEDDGRERRQVIVMDEAGGTAGFTGAANIDCKLHICRPDLAVAGNWIASEEVVHALAGAYEEVSGTMIERLLAGLAAAEAKGSDSRGIVSAAVAVVSRDSPPLELRVDLHERPIEALHEIHRAVCQRPFREFLARLPTLVEPTRC